MPLQLQEDLVQMEDGLGPNLQVWGADHHQADPHDLAWDLLAERTCSAILPGRRGISAGPLGMSRQAQPLAPRAATTLHFSH